MKKAHRYSIMSGLIALICANVSQAIPLYYTFEGSSHSYSLETSNPDVYRDITGVNLGETVSYVFLVDDRVSGGEIFGTYREYGYSLVSSDTSDNYHFAFQAELVAGSGLSFDEADTASTGYLYGNLNYSTLPSSPFYNTPGYTESHLKGGWENGSINIFLNPYVPRSNAGSYEDFSRWMGDALIGTSDTTLSLRDDEGNNYRYRNDFTLTSVSSEQPNTSVPEPATYLLMTLGLIGMGGRRFKSLLF